MTELDCYAPGLTKPLRSPFVAVDWGTSRFRCWSLSAQACVLGHSRGDFGMAGLEQSDFADVLETQLAKHGVAATTPVLICGMAGAAQGWYEAPYLSSAAGLLSLGEHAVRIPDVSRDVFILPGVMQSEPNNVMRGEETQLLGLLATQARFSGTVCMPGTHTKWVAMDNGSIKRFTTCMTGELFALLSTQSVLKHSVTTDGWDERAFDAAVLDVIETPTSLATKLFDLRAASLLQDQSPATSRARLSGMLIGLELAASTSVLAEDVVTLIGDSSLCQTYARALSLMQVRSDTMPAEKLTLQGLVKAYIQIEDLQSGA